MFFAFFMTSLLFAAEPSCLLLTPGEAQVVAKTNEARTAAGVTVLTTDCRLMSNARRQARAMAEATTIFHSTEQVRAENVAGGQPTAADAVVVWLCSPPHRANILNRSWSKVGCAGFVGPDGRCYWVQQFE